MPADVLWILERDRVVKTPEDREVDSLWQTMSV